MDVLAPFPFWDINPGLSLCFCLVRFETETKTAFSFTFCPEENKFFSLRQTIFYLGNALRAEAWNLTQYTEWSDFYSHLFRQQDFPSVDKSGNLVPVVVSTVYFKFHHTPSISYLVSHLKNEEEKQSVGGEGVR